MSTLTITENRNPNDATANDVERLRMALDDITPTQIQEVLQILLRTPRKPRSDKKKGEQP